MSTRWGDDSDKSDHYRDEQPREEPHEPREPLRRKKLALKPRSQAAASTASHASSAKSNPFGAAKPREEVLASKGIDPKLVEERIEKKATTIHYTREQEAQIAVVQAELTKAEAALREANENELPEEKYRVVVEEKRKELVDMLAKFAAEAVKEEPSDLKGRKFERPSERRRRLDEEKGHGHGHDGDHHGDDNDAFVHFGGRNKHHDEY